MRLRLYHIFGYFGFLVWIGLMSLVAYMCIMYVPEDGLLGVLVIIIAMLLSAIPFSICYIALKRSGKREIKDNYVISYSYFGKELYRVDMQKPVYAIKVEIAFGINYIVISNREIVASNKTKIFECISVRETIGFEKKVYFKRISPSLREEIWVENRIQKKMQN